MGLLSRAYIAAHVYQVILSVLLFVLNITHYIKYIPCFSMQHFLSSFLCPFSK